MTLLVAVVVLLSGSEDCFYLNVWAPKNRSADHPVLVWLHGGAFNSGSGAAPIYDGETMAAKGPSSSPSTTDWAL